MGTDSIPYLASPGTIKTAFERIRSAATPDRVTGDYVSAILNIKGGTGRALVPFLKKIGFVGSDGAPTDLYKRFRNPEIGGTAVADAIKHGYKKLSEVNQFFYALSDNELKALIVQVTGVDANSQVAKLTFATLKTLKGYAKFDAKESPTKLDSIVPIPEPIKLHKPPADDLKDIGFGMNLSYTINLNLPATSDQAVFNAIFRSLKEHLLSNAE